MSNGTVLSGSLDFLSLGDLLQLLGSNGCTGELRLKSKYAQDPGRVYIVKGNPVNASNGSLAGLDAVTSLFGWTVGEFEFDSRNVNCEPVIKKSRMSIVLDCLSMLDEGDIEILGPVSYDKKPVEKSAGGIILPSIKGPLVDYMYVVDEEEFTDGEKITVEGKHGNWIWVIMEGTVEIEKSTPLTGDTVKLLRLGEGAFLGSTAAFKMGGNVRGATAIASGDVLLGVLDSQRLAVEYAKMTIPFKGVVDSLDRRLRDVIKHSVEIRLKQNTAKEMLQDMNPVIKQGDSEEKIFAVSKGSACLVRRTKYGYVPLASLLQGDVFGRIPFLDVGHEPDAASVFGSEDLKVKSLDVEDLKNEFDALSTTFQNMLEHIATSIVVTTRLACNFQRKHHPAKSKKT